MPKPMTEDRLAETGTAIYNLLLAARTDPVLREWARTANDGFEFFRAELAAKAAECERLRAALTGIASDVCWMDCRKRHPKEWKSQPREHPEAHDENCPKRIAHDALYPESTE